MRLALAAGAASLALVCGSWFIPGTSGALVWTQVAAIVLAAAGLTRAVRGLLAERDAAEADANLQAGLAKRFLSERNAVGDARRQDRIAAAHQIDQVARAGDGAARVALAGAMERERQLVSLAEDWARTIRPETAARRAEQYRARGLDDVADVFDQRAGGAL